MNKLATCISVLCLLTACAVPKEVTVVEPVYINIQVPETLMASCNIPVPPTRATLESLGAEAQSVVAAWTLALHGALETCADRQDGLVRVIRNYQAEIRRQNAMKSGKIKGP